MYSDVSQSVYKSNLSPLPPKKMVSIWSKLVDPHISQRYFWELLGIPPANLCSSSLTNVRAHISLPFDGIQWLIRWDFPPRHKVDLITTVCVCLPPSTAHQACVLGMTAAFDYHGRQFILQCCWVPQRHHTSLNISQLRVRLSAWQRAALTLKTCWSCS